MRHLRPLGINFRVQIRNWLKKAEPGDTVLVAFSGHGFLDGRGQGLLAPKDCEKDNDCPLPHVVADRATQAATRRPSRIAAEPAELR